ncbi:MAG: SPOR domain-containing protein, partial [Gammaproteobacteria bacterium]|nr:SPOR domain-containing protein [Gammaproteobacteria bacterium]
HKQSGGMPGAVNVLAGAMLGAPQGKGLALDFSFIASIPTKYALSAVALIVVLLVAFLTGGGDETVEPPRLVNVPLELPGLQSQTGGAIPLTDPASPSAPTSVTSAPSADASTPATLPVRQIAATTPAPVVPPPATSTVAAVAAVATPAPAAPTTRAVTPAAENAATGSGQQARILALPANQFTLQVLGASSRANVEQFVQRHSASSLLWYETRNNGNPWFVVIQGAYASRESARSALAGLPAELRDQQPWVRSLEEVHTEIRARN